MLQVQQNYFSGLIQPIMLLICDVVVIVAVVVSLTPSYLQFTAPFWQLPHLSQGFRWWQIGLPVICFYFYPTTVVAEKILFVIKAYKVVFLAEKRLSSGLSLYEIAVVQVPLICASKTRRRDAYHRGDRFRQQANWDQNIYMFPVLFCLM